MTKGDLIKMLQEDNSPLDIPINIYLECTNNDTGIYGEIEKLTYDKRFKKLNIIGEYEEDEY